MAGASKQMQINREYIPDIKLVRTLTGWGLRETKTQVDYLAELLAGLRNDRYYVLQADASTQETLRSIGNDVAFTVYVHVSHRLWGGREFSGAQAMWADYIDQVHHGFCTAPVTPVISHRYPESL